MTGWRFHHTMEMAPARPWSSKSPSVSTPIKQSTIKKQGVRARYGAELPPFISIVRCPGRPVILGMENLGPWYGGGAKRMGGGKRTRERALPKIFGPLQKSFCSALPWIFVQEKQSTDTRAGWKTYRTRGVQNPFLEGVSFVRFSSPLFFPPPMASSENRLWGGDGEAHSRVGSGAPVANIANSPAGPSSPKCPVPGSVPGSVPENGGVPRVVTGFFAPQAPECPTSVLRVSGHVFDTPATTWRTKIAPSQSLAISALTEPNRQKSHRKKGFWAQKSQPEIANR